MPNTITRSRSPFLAVRYSIFDAPVRNVVRRTTHRVVGYHSSRKMGALLGWESQIESLYFELLEVDPEILKFYAQPVTIKFKNGRYTPDVMVVSRTSEYFVEVKPDSVFRDDETMERIKSLQKHFIEFGSELRLITKSELVRQPLRENVEGLLRRARFDVSEKIIQQLLNHSAGNPIKIDDLNALAGLPHDDFSILDAVLAGYFSLDLSEPINGRSIVKAYRGA